jgi:hypothetical protein
MNKIKRIVLSTLIIFTFSCSYGQSEMFKTFKYEHNDSYTKLNFSFDIPSNWDIVPETIDGTGYFLLCKPTSDSEAVKFNNCFGGLVFRIKVRGGNLDSVLREMGLRQQSEKIYLTNFNGKIKIVPTWNIKGETYNGLVYTITDKVFCTDKKKSKIMANYEYIYLNNGNKTIIIETNGRKLDENVFKKIVETFKFI